MKKFLHKIIKRIKNKIKKKRKLDYMLLLNISKFFVLCLSTLFFIMTEVIENECSDESI